MKRKVLIALMAGICLIGVISPGLAAQTKPSTATPLRLCFWPKVWGWPSGMNVRGVNFGIANFGNEGNDVVGWDFGLLLSQTNDVTGFQSSFLNMTKNITGAQLALMNMTNDFAGAQFGFVNLTEKSKLFQLGFINKADQSKGFQLGLINIMDNGFFPVFPFFNYSVSKK